MLCPVVYDVRKDQPAGHSEVRACGQRLGQSRLIEGLHVAPQARVLLEAKRMDGRQVVEHESVVPYVGFPDLVPDAELPPAPVDVDKMSEGLKSTVVIKLLGCAQLLVR